MYTQNFVKVLNKIVKSCFNLKLVEKVSKPFLNVYIKYLIQCFILKHFKIDNERFKLFFMLLGKPIFVNSPCPTELNRPTPRIAVLRSLCEFAFISALIVAHPLLSRLVTCYYDPSS